MITVKNQDACDTLGPDKFADLVFMDPPFNIGEKYDVCNDSKPDDQFENNLLAWSMLGAMAIKPTGSLWIHVPDRWAANVVCFLRDRYHMRLQNWIIWHYRFGQCQPNRFINSKCHGLWFSWDKPKVNRDAGLVPSLRVSQYDDERSVSGERMDLDVWGFDRYWGRVQGNNHERRPLHENQLPELYLKRIIELTTDEGDLVVDPFGGSGTTAVVCQTLNRNCLTGDISPAYCRSIEERLQKGAVRC